MPENTNTKPSVVVEAEEFLSDDTDLNTKLEEPGLSEPTPQEKAEKAVTKAILNKNGSYIDQKGNRRKIHNLTDAHLVVWNQLTADGRSNDFQVMSLLWCLLKPAKQILKFAALNIPQVRMQVLQFMVAEKRHGEELEQIENVLADMLEDLNSVQVRPKDDPDEDSDGPGKF